MKQAALLVLGALSQHGHGVRVDSATLFTRVFGAEAAAGAMTPEDLANCISAAGEAGLQADDMNDKATFIEKWGDHCAVDKKIQDSNYVCPHFKEALSGALMELHSSNTHTTEEYCKASEQYMLNLRGATRVSNMGSGALTNFKLSPTCVPTIDASLAPAKSVKAPAAADFWYALCMDQDCGNYLPSRTRWCETSGKPTHSQQVCEAARRFMEDGADALDEEDLDAEALCHLYSDFVAETGLDVEAYEHVMHDDSGREVPVPHDQERALTSSRLQNNAAKNHLRDNAGKPVKPLRSSAYRMPGFVALAATVAAAGASLS